MEYYSQMQLIKQKEAEELYRKFSAYRSKHSQLTAIREQHDAKTNSLQETLGNLKNKISEIKEQSLKQG